MSDQRLTLDRLADPGLYRLTMMISDTGMDVVITSRVHDNDLIYTRIDFPENTDTLKAIEEAVYDNPLLTADFGKVDVLLDTNRFFVMAADDATPEEVRRRIDLLWPPENQEGELRPVISPVEADRTVIVCAVPRKLAGFLRRTFNNPPVWHRVAAVSRYHGLKNRLGNTGKMYVRQGAGRTDIIAYGRTGLLMANTFVTHTVDDAVYYALAAAQYLGYDNDSDRILVSGNRAMRDEFVGAMRRFKSFVMPDIFPSALTRLGDEVMNVPFELLVPTLCD